MDEISAFLNLVAKALPNVEIRQNEPMKNHTSFKIGGPVRAMLFPETENDTVSLCKLCRETGMIPMVMGNGSNILATDNALSKVVINTSKLKNIELTESVIKADAGALLSAIAVFALDNELAGFEFAHGIPGSIGGAVVMNAGAYGGEMKDVTVVTTVYSNKMGLYEIKDEQHEFSYRHSRFSQSDDFIISSTIRLQKGNKEEIREKMNELSAKRRASQPLDLPSAGSTFKRPINGYAAELIDKAGLKGFSIGGAEVSSKHAGFIVNKGGATFSDTMKLIEHVKETVLKEFGVTLESEIKLFS